MNPEIGQMSKPLQQLLGGFIRLHVLHHAAEDRGVVGNWMIEELRHHGYRLSPGTLYPMLHAMEEEGWLRGESAPEGGRKRVYRITPHGADALATARVRLKELFREVDCAVVEPWAKGGCAGAAGRAGRRDL